MYKFFKLKLYLETTTFNWYFDERPGHEEVARLFEAIKAGQFAGYTSQYVTEELKKASEPKRTNMLSLIEKYGIIELTAKTEILTVAEEYITAGILPQSQQFDSLHIAAASVYGIDGIVSYNFHHINRDKTKAHIPLINKEHGLGEIMFFTAEEVFQYVQLLQE